MAEKLKLHSPILRLVYPYAFTARMSNKPKPGEKARFSTTGLILPTDKLAPKCQALHKALVAGCVQLAVDKLGREKVGVMLTEKTLKLPFRKDVQSKGFPAEFAEFIKPWSNYQPGVVSVFKDPNTGKPTPISDPSKVYSGLWARLSVTPFWYDTDGNKGVGLWLNNILMVKTPEGQSNSRIDGNKSAEDEFEDEGEDGESADTLADAIASSGSADSTKDELAALLGTGA